MYIYNTLPETNSLPLKMGPPWKRRFRNWKPPFLGAMWVSGRVYIHSYILGSPIAIHFETLHKNKLITIYRSPMMLFNFECRCEWFSDVFLWTPPIWALELDLTSQIIPLFLQHELSTQVVLRKHGPLWTNSGMVHFSLEGLYESYILDYKCIYCHNLS